MKILILLLPLFVSCASLKSIDKPVCVEINIAKGYCTTIISGEGFIVDDENLLDGKTWFEARLEMVQVPVETWAALKKYLIKNCRRSKSCNANIDSWNRSIKTIDAKLIEKNEALSPVTAPNK
jgi:hypothetical protein